MKKVILFMVLAALGVTSYGQSLNVQSAIAEIRSKRLDKAKKYIDEAIVHESTKDDPKTWRWKAAVYYEINFTDKDKYKTLVTNPLDTALEAALKCKEMDKQGEFAQELSQIFKGISIGFYNNGVNAFKASNWQKALNNFTLAARLGDYNTDNKDNTMNSLYYGGAAAEYLKDTANIIKNYQLYVNRKYTNSRPYIMLYQMYKANNDTVKVMDVLTKLQSNIPTDPESHILMASGYAWIGNNAKAKEALNSALAIKNNDTIATKVGTILEETGDIEGAKEKYEQVLKNQPQSYDANYRLGALFFNFGVEKVKAASGVPYDDNTGLADKYSNEAKDAFNKSLPYLETAVSVKPDDYYALNALKQIYFRLNDMEKYNAIDARIKEVLSKQNQK